MKRVSKIKRKLSRIKKRFFNLRSGVILVNLGVLIILIAVFVYIGELKQKNIEQENIIIELSDQLELCKNR